MVVMIGTSPATRGGIASVVRAWRDAGLFERWPITYVATHRDGSALSKLGAFFRALATVAQLMLRHRHAVLYVHGASRASFWRKACFMAMALVARWPFVFHLHGGGFARFYEKECGPIRRAAVRFFLDRAAAIVAVSERWQAWLALATRNANVVCIPNAIALRPLTTTPREEDLVLFLGRCDEGKGVFELLEVMANLPHVRLVCAGDGDLARVAARARALGIDARVRLAGWLGSDACADLLRTCTVFALPSHAEGVPMSMLEAMAAGAPVVASAVGGIPDIVRHGENGLLVTPGDTASLAHAIERVIRDRAFAERLGAGARDTVARTYTVERAVARVDALLSQFHEQPAAAPPRALQEMS